MSGSAAQVLLRAPLTDDQRLQLEAFIRSVSSSEDWNSFWLLGQPYTMSLHEPDKEEALFHRPGWSPKQMLLVSCHCRGLAGDVLLAFVLSRLAEMFDGLIGFGGSLEKYTTNPSVLTLEGRYRSEEIGDVLTPGFLNYWAGSPEFRMSN